MSAHDCVTFDATCFRCDLSREEGRVAMLARYQGDGLRQDDMCDNCVTPWRCNGPHLPPGLHDLDEVIAELGIDLSEGEEVQS